MTRTEWAELVKRMNASFPNRPVDPATAAEWLEELRPFGSAEVWAAIRRCRRERPFAPALAQILEAVDANDRDDRERQRAEGPSVEHRTCAECATATVPGQIVHVLPVNDRDNPYPHPVEVAVPCPGCRGVRAEVLAKGGMAAMHLRTDRDGRPTAWRRPQPVSTA